MATIGQLSNFLIQETNFRQPKFALLKYESEHYSVKVQKVANLWLLFFFCVNKHYDNIMVIIIKRHKFE